MLNYGKLIKGKTTKNCNMALKTGKKTKKSTNTHREYITAIALPLFCPLARHLILYDLSNVVELMKRFVNGMHVEKVCCHNWFSESQEMHM